MKRPLLVVTGTGTEIGKTVVACGLVAAWGRRGGAIAGLKPIESGQTSAGHADVQSLGRVSTFHVTRFTPPYLLMDPVSPHLAARREGRVIDPDVVVRWVEPIRDAADGVVLELPGGLFTPISDEHTNADLLLRLAPSIVLLVAPDRLGVIHDVLATTRAARGQGIRVDGLVLSSPAIADSSTGTNAGELTRGAPQVPVLGVLPRTNAEELAPYFDAILARLPLGTLTMRSSLSRS